MPTEKQLFTKPPKTVDFTDPDTFELRSRPGPQRFRRPYADYRHCWNDVPRRTDGFTARRHSEPVRYPLRKANIDRRSGNGGRCEIGEGSSSPSLPDSARTLNVYRPDRFVWDSPCRIGFDREKADPIRDLRNKTRRDKPRRPAEDSEGRSAVLSGAWGDILRGLFRRKMKANLAKGTTYRERGLGPVWGPATAGRAKTINTKPASSRVKRNFRQPNPTTCAQRGQRLERNLTMPEK